MSSASIVSVVAALLLAPLLSGLINRAKAFFAGRRGIPVLQLYADLWKLMRKGAVYGESTSWMFRAGPVVNLASVVVCVFVVPLGSLGAPVAFPGDAILFLYLLALGRFFTISAAMDTGSSFEAMGASRDVQFSALIEPAMLLALGILLRLSGSFTLSHALAGASPSLWSSQAPAFGIVVVVLFVLLLAENCRIPVDDPNTHLELTMIHEVMVLDHGGPDLAFILYAGALKLWVFCLLVADVAVPAVFESRLVNSALTLAGVFICAVIVGIVESTMARLRLLRVPQLLIGASALAAAGFLLIGTGG